MEEKALFTIFIFLIKLIFYWPFLGLFRLFQWMSVPE